MKQQKNVRANTLFTLAALLVVLMCNVYVGRAQTNELPDTVWTKFTYPYAINAVKFTPDGRYLASGGDDSIPRLWDAETGELIKEFPKQNHRIFDIDISKKFIAFQSPGKEGLKIYNVNNFSLSNTLYGGLTLKFSTDGDYLVTGNSQNSSGISVYNTANWEVLNEIDFEKATVDLIISQDGKFLAKSENYYSLQNDDKIGNIKVFTFPDLQFVKTLERKEYLYCSDLDFSPDGKYLAGAFSSGPNKIWNTSDWKLFKEFGEQWSNTKTIQFSKDNNFVVYGPLVNLEQGAFVRILEYNNLTIKYSYKLNYYMGFFGHDKGDWAYCIDINDNNDRIAVGTGAGLYLLNAKWNPTSVEESIQILEPEIFPNPNDGKAIIRFNLLKNTEVSVDIYDINSKLISNIFKGQLNSGIQSYEWLAKVPNGIYFARISSGKSLSSIKIIVQR